VRAARATEHDARSAIAAKWTWFERTRPGRYVQALLAMRLVERALALSSKLFIAILPLSILSAAVVSRRSFGDQLVIRLRLTGEGAVAARALFATPAQVQSAMGLVGVVVLVSSVVSFARALERVYLDCWELPPQRAAVRGRLAWLAGFCLYLGLFLPARAALVATGAEGLTGVVSALGAGLLFLWTPYVLLGGRVTWRRLLPTAAISGVSVVVFGFGSTIVMPGVLTHNSDRYGYIGVAFSLVTWLFCAAVVIIAAAVLGRLVEQWRSGLPGAVAASSEADDVGGWPAT
jgi:membrane protein